MSGEYWVPGKGQVRHEEAPAAEEEEFDLGTPRILNYRGEPMEFYPIGSLAYALNRSVVTMRKWEKAGYLPKPAFGIPTKALGGKIRLYTRDQIMRLRRIASEEGLLEDLAKSVKNTQFRRKAREVFGLREEG